MPESKKLSKNKKFNVIVIYGAPAVGKFTVAEMLHKMINYKFFHNHHTHDLVRQLFERGGIHSDRITHNIRFLIFKEIATAKIDVVTTHTYSKDFISKNGITDPRYMKKIESIIEKGGGRACFVQLVADEKELLKRVGGKSRARYLKLMDKNIMQQVLESGDWRTPAPVKHNLIIDNTNLSPKKVVDIIIKHFNI